MNSTPQKDGEAAVTVLPVATQPTSQSNNGTTSMNTNNQTIPDNTATVVPSVTSPVIPKGLLDQLYEAIGKRARFWRGNDGESYATVDQGGHERHLGIRSEEFKSWLFEIATVTTSSVSGVTRAVSELADICDLKARGEEQRPVGTRVILIEGESYIDLGDKSGRQLRVNERGWEIISKGTQPLMRHKCTGKLPEPISGSRDKTVELMRPFLRVPDERSRHLIVAYNLYALNGRGPFPIVVIQGPGGSAKTSVARVIKRFIDPTTSAGLEGRQKEERDLTALAKKNYLSAFDNLSGMTPMMADSLCRLATGGDFGARKLYSDNDSATVELCRPVVLTGIDSMLDRDDMALRSLLFSLQPFSDSDPDRIAEEKFNKQLQQASQGIFSALIRDLVATKLALKDVKLSKEDGDFRMLDFAEFCKAYGHAIRLPPDYMIKALRRNVDGVSSQAIEQDPVAGAILAAVAAERDFFCSVSEMHTKLSGYTDDATQSSQGWPKNPTALGLRFDRLRSTLAGAGVKLERLKETDGTYWYLERTSSYGGSGTSGTFPSVLKKEEEGIAVPSSRKMAAEPSIPSIPSRGAIVIRSGCVESAHTPEVPKVWSSSETWVADLQCLTSQSDDQIKVPHGFSTARWQQIVRDCQVVYDVLGDANQRGELPYCLEDMDIFGVDAEQPDSPYGRSLVLRLCGGKLAVEDGEIVITSLDGVESEFDPSISTTCSKFIWGMDLEVTNHVLGGEVVEQIARVVSSSAHVIH